jgi:PAS domain S-box-containing protein
MCKAPVGHLARSRVATPVEKRSRAGRSWPHRERRISGPIGFVLAGIAAFAIYPFLGGGLLYDAWYQLYGVSTLTAVVLGIRRNRPADRRPWQLLAAGIGAAVAGDLVFLIAGALGRVLPYPSPADALYLTNPVLIAAGLLLMLHRRAPGRDATSLIDAAIVTAGAATLSWVLLLHPDATHAETRFQQLVSAAYPVTDILILAVAARLLVIGGRRTRAFSLLVCAVSVQLIGDSLYAFGSLKGWYADGNPIDLIALTSYALWGATALDPSMETLTAPQKEPERHLSTRRLAVLVIAGLLAPATVVLEAVEGDRTGVLAAAAFTVVLFALVVLRIAILTRRQETIARREESLRRAAAALVAARDAADVARVVAVAGPRLAGGSSTSARLVTADRGKEDAARGEVLFPLAVLGQDETAIAVRADGTLDSAVAKTLETFAAQVGLALEGAALTSMLLERQSSERFRALVQNSSDVIVVLELDGSIRYHTPSLENLLGYSGSQLIGEPFVSLVQPDQQAVLLDLFAAVRDDMGGGGRHEFHAVRRDGGSTVLEGVFANLLGNDYVNGIVLTARDVTQRKRLEKQLVHQAFHDALTGLANRLCCSTGSPTASPASGGRESGCASSSSISTTSRPSTTASGTRRATSCSPGWESNF